MWIINVLYMLIFGFILLETIDVIKKEISLKHYLIIMAITLVVIALPIIATLIGK